MKINDIYESITGTGSIASVIKPMTTQSRNASIYGGKKGGDLLTGKKSKAKYANSVYESKMKQLATDLKDMDNGNFKKKYGKDKEQMKLALGDPHVKKTVHENVSMDLQTKKQLLRYADAFRMLEVLEKAGAKVLEVRPGGETTARFLVDINGRHHLLTMNKVGQLSEAHLEEDDLILVPGQGHRLKSGFIPHDKDRTDHEVEMAKSDLFQAAKNAKTVYELIADVSEDEGLEGWVQEKIIKANDYLNSIREYLEHKMLQNETGGVIAAGGINENIMNIGAYTTDTGGTLKLVRNTNDPKHLMLVNQKGEVVKSHHGDVEDFHQQLRKNGLKGAYKNVNEGAGEKIKYTNPAQLKAMLNKAGLFYSGDRNDFGNNFSSKSGESYDIMPGGNSWRHYSGASGKDVESLIAHIKANKKLQNYNRQSGVTNEAQSMGAALKNTLAKAEPGSKLDNSIKSHNRHIKAGLPGTLKNAPTGYHFDKKGYCRLGEK